MLFDFLSRLPQPLWEGEGAGSGAPPESAPPAEGASPPEGTPPAEKEKSLISGEGDNPPPAEGGDFTTPITVEGLTLPEGMTVDQDGMSDFVELINGAESKEDLANKMLGMFSDVMRTVSTQQSDLYNNTMTEWRTEVQQSPEFGGDKLDQSLARAKEIAKEFGGEGFLNLLDVTGVGNNIHVVGLLNRIYEALPREPGPISGQPAPSGVKTLAERLYPNQ